MTLRIRHLQIAAAVLGFAVLFLYPAMGRAAENSVAGRYVCRSTGGKPCDTHTDLDLTESGVWRWGRYTGRYIVRNGRVEWDGVGGAASWGAATIGPDTLNFNEFGDNSIWQKASAAPTAQLPPGSYYCYTRGCQTGMPIELRSDGTFKWGADAGNYTIVGGQVRFGGTTSGPGGWGLADIGNGALIFHVGSAISEWRLSTRANITPCDPRVPDYRQPGCVK